MSHQDDNTFFFDTFVPLCEQAFRFNYFISGNVSKSFACLRRVAEDFYEETKTLDSDSRLVQMVKHCWQALEKSPRSIKPAVEGEVVRELFALTVDERAQLAASDCLGLEDQELREIFATDGSVQDIRDKLAKDRDYDEHKGQLQELFRGVSLKDNHHQELRDLLLPGYDADVVQKHLSHEAESAVSRQRWTYYLVLAIVLVVLVGGLAWYFYSESSNESLVIEYLGYETLAIEEEGERINFPSDSLAEIRSYFANHRGLGFEPQVLRLPSWLPQGASIIDYNPDKVAVVKYQHRRSNDVIFFYTFAGKLQNLNAPSENADNFVHKIYASDDLNMVAWTQGQVVAVLAGRLSSADLVSLGQVSQK